MTPAARRSRYQRSTGCSLTKPWPPSSWTPSEPIFIPFWEQSRRAMAASRAKLSPRSARLSAREGARRLPFLPDPDFGDREGDALAVGDRFAERLAVVDVGDHVVEHRLRGPGCKAAPGNPRAVDAGGVVLAARLTLAEQRLRRQFHFVDQQAAGGGGPQAH